MAERRWLILHIVREGNKELLYKIRTFECDECGCIFEANKDEYKYGEQYNETYYYCVCPCCQRTTYHEVKLPK